MESGVYITFRDTYRNILNYIRQIAQTERKTRRYDGDKREVKDRRQRAIKRFRRRFNGHS